MQKRKWLWICCMTLLLSLPLQPVMANEESTWHALPAGGQGGAYICGRYQLVNCVNRDGVLYVNMGLFGMMISDGMPDIDWETGVVRFHIRNAEADGSTLTISVQGDNVDISYDGNTVVWQHQPYWRENKGEGVLPDLMLPLRDICQTLNMAVQYQNGIIFVGYMQPPLVLPSAEEISSLQTKMAIPVKTVSENSYSLVTNNGQVVVQSDAIIPIWQTPNDHEGALFLTAPEGENQVLSVQELQNNGQLKTLYTLPKLGRLDYSWNHVNRVETMAGPVLFVNLVNDAQSQASIYYLVQSDGTLRNVLESNLIDSTIMTKDNIYYIQNQLFGARSYLVSIALNNSKEISEELDRAGMSYRGIELIDEKHLLAHVWSIVEERPKLYLVDLSSSQYQPITDQSWEEYVLAGSWIYGLHAEDQCIYRFRTDGSELTRVTGKAKYFGKAVSDNTAVTYVDEKNCLWVVGDQNTQLTTVPVEQWHAVGDQIFYRISGATAGIYVYDRQSGQQKCLLTGEYKDMAVSDTGQVVVLPFVGQSIALYQDGAWQTISLGE